MRGYEKLGHEAFLDFRSMIAAAPQLVRYQAYRSVYTMVAKFIRDPQLREAFSFHTCSSAEIRFGPVRSMRSFMRWRKSGACVFPRGGTHALVRGLVRLFEDLGGEVRMGSPVTALRTTGDKVTGVACADGWSAGVRRGRLQRRRRHHLPRPARSSAR